MGMYGAFAKEVEARIKRFGPARLRQILRRDPPRFAHIQDQDTVGNQLDSGIAFVKGDKFGHADAMTGETKFYQIKRIRVDRHGRAVVFMDPAPLAEGVLPDPSEQERT